MTAGAGCMPYHEPRTTAEALDALMARIGGQFARSEPRRTARLYLEALLQAEGRKTAAHIAEHIAGRLGESRVDAVQRLLGSARWDADRVRDELVAAVGCRVGHAAGTLVLHHHCFPKRGAHSVGVEEHYCPQTRRLERSQVAVLAVFESGDQRYLVDRELFLPEAWVDDRRRRQVAGVPDDIGYRTMDHLAAQIVRRCARSLRVREVVAGRDFGRGQELRRAAEAVGVSSTVEMSDTQARHLEAAHGPDRRGVRERAPRERRALRSGPAWRRLPLTGSTQPGSAQPGSAQPGSAQPGSAQPGSVQSGPAQPGPASEWERFVLLRGGTGAPSGLICSLRPGTPVQRAVAAVGALRRGAECVEQACDRVGLDSYECRRWTSWYRHVTLASSALYCRAARPPGVGPAGGRTAQEVTGAGRPVSSLWTSPATRNPSRTQSLTPTPK